MPQKDIRFELLARSGPHARRSRFETEHGPVECPAFMPVGTQGAVKAVTPDQVLATESQVILGNTFHLSIDGRRELVKRSGGLHKLMNWPRTILTDSGGFQVFSLPGTKVDEEGVTFRYGKEGQEEVIRMDAESSMAIQRDLGADIVMAFDQCVGYPAKKSEVLSGLERTTRWAKRCRAAELAPHQYLFGIVQGGTHDDLRRRSAKELREIPFDGFAIGGVSVGEGLELLKKVVSATAPLLPEDLPRYLMGVGLPEDILASVDRGMDMFDCVIPTRYARGGTLFTRTGKIRIGDKRYRKDRYPIDTACICYTCKNWSRAILRHLHYAGEPLAHTLATIHNITFYQDLMRDIRKAIEEDRYATFQREWLESYLGKSANSGGSSNKPSRKRSR